MKSLLLLLILSSTVYFSCKKSEQPEKHPPGVPTSAETKPQYDNTSFGVYKGVVIGSSGMIIIKVNNGDNLIIGYLTIDNLKDTLLASQSVTAGQPINDLQLTGKFSSLNLSAGSNGSNAQINNLVISGHPNATAIIVHENSTQQVLLYEGNFTGEISGRINFVKVGTEIRSAPVDYIAKVSTDNYFIRGSAHPEQDTGSRSHTHYFHDHGGYVRGFTGYVIFNLSKVTGSYNSYVHQELRSYRGTIDCARTY